MKNRSRGLGLLILVLLCISFGGPASADIDKVDLRSAPLDFRNRSLYCVLIRTRWADRMWVLWKGTEFRDLASSNQWEFHKKVGQFLRAASHLVRWGNVFIVVSQIEVRSSLRKSMSRYM